MGPKKIMFRAQKNNFLDTGKILFEPQKNTFTALEIMQRALEK